MQGVVQATEFTKKGVQKFQISGQWYYAGRCNVDGLAVGSEIEFGFNEFGEDQGRGRLKGLDFWKPITRGQSRASQGNGANTLQRPQERVSQAVTITDVDVLRSVSNIVGSACAAGTVKCPEELEKWFQAAWYGLLRKSVPAEREPGSDDGHDSEEPPFNDPLDF